MSDQGFWAVFIVMNLWVLSVFPDLPYRPAVAGFFVGYWFVLLVMRMVWKR